ncbi:hypothetical protein Kpol_1010p23 [Vanderwaltozyma polyspora DSM 70294]|uniref:Uncharacterized protein n=1 Tax=Vanderwaltozyma polyspora (strain ATCC 22028 / DSM 70294 / BCRC 21397 / CBS 2163 / NBRC 10782 / NRRL Y-8283 / UCD 57-17) TaxID=436907 RepID=A7TIH0_VANPO|nr:uncharacterized protein Kpol_1010p23 [Vanderwaltozyma polyspora DSM 70294]EDO17908.1 hypothetical protein Kpol_1010p23 [Vanderwaltozyma polyspora DSM 70294]
MPENKRVTSEALNLHPFSIVDKQTVSVNTEEDDYEVISSAIGEPGSVPSIVVTEGAGKTPLKDLVSASPRRTGIQLSLPVESTPTKKFNSKEQLSKDTDISKDQFADNDEYQGLLYKLASKRRLVIELREQLKSEEKELKLIEEELSKFTLSSSNNKQGKETSKSPMNTQNTDFIGNLSKQIHKAIDDVNNSPNVIQGKKSISNFFAAKSAETQPNRNSASTPFFKQLMDKFNEFSVNEDEEDEFDKSRSTDEYFVKDANTNYEYDDENIIEEEPEGILKIGKQHYKR